MGSHEPINTQQANQSEEIGEQASFLLGLIENQITRADTKAGLIVAADTVFSAGLILLSEGAIAKIVDGSASFGGRLTAVFIILTFAALSLSILSALLVARPIMQADETGGTLFFFGRVSQLSYQDFAENFSGQSSAQFRDALLNEVYTTARMANQKFKRIRYSLDFLIAAAVFWALVQFMVALGH